MPVQTLFVDCNEAFYLANKSFHNWVIPEADYEKPAFAEQQIENLHEGSKYAGTFPWKFTAFKKVTKHTLLLLNYPLWAGDPMSAVCAGSTMGQAFGETKPPHMTGLTIS